MRALSADPDRASDTGEGTPVYTGKQSARIATREESGTPAPVHRVKISLHMKCKNPLTWSARDAIMKQKQKEKENTRKTASANAPATHPRL